MNFPGRSATTTYGYDADNRLTSEATPSGTRTYTYDSVGNRLSKTSGGTTTSFTYDADDRNSSSAYTYNLNGDVLNDGTRTYGYDFEDHLVESGTSVTQTATYAYDADGNRVQKIDGTGTTNDLVDSNRAYAEVLEERDGSGNVLARYDYGDDLIRMDRGSVSRYYLFDGLGSTRQLTDGTGAVTDTYAYDAFGNMTVQTGGTVNPYLFNGQEQDAGTGLYYLRARYMNPQDGRFISQDPFGGDDEDPISLHRYLYASANPVNRVDPGGELDGLAGTLVSISINIAQQTLGLGIVGAGAGYILFASTGGNGFVGATAGAELAISFALSETENDSAETFISATLTGFGQSIVDTIAGAFEGKFEHPGSDEFNKYVNVMRQHLLEAEAAGAASVAIGSFTKQSFADKALVAGLVVAVQDILDDASSFSDSKNISRTLLVDFTQILSDSFVAILTTGAVSIGQEALKPIETAALNKLLKSPSAEDLKLDEDIIEIGFDSLLGIFSGSAKHLSKRKRCFLLG